VKCNLSERLEKSHRIAIYIATAFIAQIVVWYYVTPGPQLRGSCDLQTAIGGCVVAGLVFLFLPLSIGSKLLGRDANQLGLGLGDRSFGWKSVAVLAPIMVVGTVIGSSDPQIQAFYPIAGDAVADSITSLAVWFSAYLLFYISFEFFYRGFLLKGLSDLESRRSLILFVGIQAVCCFLIHIGKPQAELIASLPASILFGWIAWRSRSIWYNVAIHFAVGIANDLGAIAQS